MDFKSYNKISIHDALRRLGIPEEDYSKMNREEAEKIVCEKCNQKFKDIKTYSQLMIFIEDMESFGFNLRIYNKRSNHESWGFQEMPWQADRVRFCKENGKVGESDVKNLYKHHIILTR